MPMKPVIPPGTGKTPAPYSPGLVKKDALIEIATVAHIGKT